MLNRPGRSASRFCLDLFKRLRTLRGRPAEAHGRCAEPRTTAPGCATRVPSTSRAGRPSHDRRFSLQHESNPEPLGSTPRQDSPTARLAIRAGRGDPRTRAARRGREGETQHNPVRGPWWFLVSDPARGHAPTRGDPTRNSRQRGAPAVQSSRAASRTRRAERSLGASNVSVSSAAALEYAARSHRGHRDGTSA